MEQLVSNQKKKPAWGILGRIGRKQGGSNSRELLLSHEVTQILLGLLGVEEEKEH